MPKGVFMKFLYFLEGIRNPVLDFLFSVITYCGDEIVFLAVSILFFWCVNKREGYYILTVGLVGTIINQTLKLLFKIPRPEKLDTSFTIVESAREAAGGYSFPSGHTQNVTGTFGAIGMWSKKRKTVIFSVAVIVLVAFSRMYLGVHTPLDVGVSLLIGTALFAAFYPMFKTEERFRKSMPWLIPICALLAVGFAIYAFTIPKEGLDPHNAGSAMSNAGTLLGCTVGLIVVYFVDTKYINFRTDAPWYFQIVKLVLGFGIIMGIKVGLSAPLTALFGNQYVARAVRYFLIVIVAGVVWPLTFGYFATHRIKKLDEFGERVSKKLSEIFKRKDSGEASEK